MRTMRRLTNRKIRLLININFLDEKGEVFAQFRTLIPTKAKRLIAEGEFSKVYVKVTYFPTVWNDGEYETAKDAVKALSCWVEKRQLDFISSHT